MSHSSAKAEYRAMTHTVYELMSLKFLLLELVFSVEGLMPMYYDNRATIYIANNPISHERTKHIEVDCHFLRDAVSRKLIFYFIHSIF